MKILILGATGGTGKHLVTQALAAGHTVTALVRNPEAAGLSGSGLKLVKGLATNAADVAAAVAGQDAVLSALGPRTKTDPVCPEAAQATVAAMKQHGVKRVIWISAGGVGDSEPQFRAASFIFAAVIMPLVFKKPYANHLRAEEVLRASGLEFTIPRPVQLVDAGATGKAVAVPIGSGRVTKLKVARSDLAAWMLSELQSPKFVGQLPIIEG